MEKKQRDEKPAEATEQLTDEGDKQHADKAAEAEKKAAGQQHADEKAPVTEKEQEVQATEGSQAVEAVEYEANDDAVIVGEAEQDAGTEEADLEDVKVEDLEITPATAEPYNGQTSAAGGDSKAADSATTQPYIGETEKNTHPETQIQVDGAQITGGLPEIKQASDGDMIDANTALENDALQPRDERLNGVNLDAVIGAADQFTGAGQVGADSLDVFGNLGPDMGSEAVGGAFDLPGFGGDSETGTGFDPFGDFDLPGSSPVDLGSIGAGGDPRTGWGGQSLDTGGNTGRQGYGSGGSGQSGSSDDTTFGNPTGANRESPSDFGGSAGSPGDSGRAGDSGGGGSWSGTTEWNDYTDSDGNQQIDGYEEYRQEDGTTLVIQTHHDNESGTTQKVTLYDNDGSVIESEETHEPPANKGGAGSGREGGSDGGSESGSEDSGSAEAPAGSGDDSGSRPNPYADQYIFDVDISLIASNEELTTPVEPGGDNISFGAARLATFGSGIYDPRTVNPAPDGNGTDTGGGGGADGHVGEGIVDPVGPTLFAGSLGFTGQLLSSDDGFASEDMDQLDDFDPFVG